MVKLLAYHNNPKIKEMYLARVRAHVLADELIHGKYWEDGKGCAVGCTIHSGSHAAYETELGIPPILAKLEDGIFEGLTNGRSKQWPEQFLSVIPVGADLSNVWPQFAHWLMLDEKWGVIQFAKITTEVNWRNLRYADAAAAYAAADAARGKMREAQADKLLELMGAAK